MLKVQWIESLGKKDKKKKKKPLKKKKKKKKKTQPNSLKIVNGSKTSIEF